MCGLVGVAGDLNNRDRDIFNMLMLLNAQRGLDGCGIFKTWKQKNTKWYYTNKSESPSSIHVFTKSYKDFMDERDARVFLGHSRAATRGAVKKENNHPFEIDTKDGKSVGLVGAHNGTITGNFKHSDEHETDSEALFVNIQRYGLKKAIEEVWEKSYTMAYALSYYNFDNECLTLIRNSQRPLHYAFVDEKLYWSSEPRFLKAVFAAFGVDNAAIEELRPHTLLKYYPYASKRRLVLTPDFVENKTYTTTYTGRVFRNGAWDNDEAWRAPEYRRENKKDEEKKPINSSTTYFKLGQHGYRSEAFLKDIVEQKGCMFCQNQKFELKDYKFNATECCCPDCEAEVTQYVQDLEEPIPYTVTTTEDEDKEVKCG